MVFGRIYGTGDLWEGLWEGMVLGGSARRRGLCQRSPERPFSAPSLQILRGSTSPCSSWYPHPLSDPWDTSWAGGETVNLSGPEPPGRGGGEAPACRGPAVPYLCPEPSPSLRGAAIGAQPVPRRLWAQPAPAEQSEAKAKLSRSRTSGSGPGRGGLWALPRAEGAGSSGLPLPAPDSRPRPAWLLPSPPWLYPACPPACTFLVPCLLPAFHWLCLCLRPRPICRYVCLHLCPYPARSLPALSQSHGTLAMDRCWPRGQTGPWQWGPSAMALTVGTVRYPPVGMDPTWMAVGTALRQPDLSCFCPEPRCQPGSACSRTVGVLQSRVTAGWPQGDRTGSAPRGVCAGLAGVSEAPGAQQRQALAGSGGRGCPGSPPLIPAGSAAPPLQG